MEVHGSPRARRAIALIAVALAALAAGAGAYLWSAAPHPYHGPPPPATSRPIPVSMDWRSAAQGWIIVHDSGSPASFLFRTQDGGVHWQRLLSVDGPASVRFTDANHGTVQVGALRAAGLTVLRTDDGGAHWRPMAQPELEPGAALSALVLEGGAAWALTHTALYRTADAGASWQRLPGPWAVGDDDLLDVAVRPGGEAWVTGAALAGRAALFATHDGGATWTRRALPAAPPGPAAADRLEIRAPAISAAGRAVLPVYDRDADQTWLYASADAGGTWRDPLPLPAGGGARWPAFVDGGAGWTWSLTTAWSTEDGGRSWRAAAAPGGGWQFGTVAPVSGAVAWADAVQVGDQASRGPATWGLFRTSDAGLHWTRTPLPDLG
jgi:photosystem II stability/assembly factor-like uncharacterized protein